MLLSLLLLITANALAEPAPLSLDQALTEARQNNPGLARARAAADEADWRSFEALSGNLPKLSLSANHFLESKYQIINVNFGATPSSFPAIYPLSQVSLDAQWTVFDGLSTPRLYVAARHAATAAQREAKYAELQVENEVRLRYYQSLAAIGLAEVARQNLKTLEEHFDRVKALLKQGEATQFDQLRIQVQLEQAVPERAEADDNVVLARQALARAMGKESDERLPEGKLPAPDEATDEWARNAQAPDLAAREDYQAILERAEAADLTRAAGNGAFLPRFGLIAQHQWYNNITGSIGDPYRTAYNFGLLLTWSLFDGSQIARQREAAYAGAQAEAQAQAARIRAPGEVETQKRKLLQSSALFRARTRAIEAAQESVRLARIGQGAGTRTNADVLDAELDWFRAREGRVRAQLQALEAMMNLELALGRRYKR